MSCRKPFAVLIAVALFAASGAALADKPSWAGGGKKHERDDDRYEDRRDDRHTTGGAYFRDEDRRIIGDYYGKQARAGNCPPGLAKKNNGCLPPGQAKKWAKGQPLPGDLGYNDLPYELLRRLPPAPANHRYVQVAGDVLLIATGTRMVVDAIQDILR